MIASVTRGKIIDTTYEGHIAVCDAQGHLLFSQGDPQRRTFARSSTKPFQVAAAILTGAIDHYDIDEEEMALMCGSHAGSPRHIAVLERILEKGGLTPEHLQCGPHPPFDYKARKMLSAPPTALHNNCSAKHAAMLLSAKYLGEDLRTYTELAHPHQQRITELIAELCDAQMEEFAYGIDGCGVPVHALPMRKFATSFARLTDASSLRAPLKDALKRAEAAMAAHPFMVSGENRICTRLMEAFPGRVIAKGGASAFYAVSLPKEKLGIAFKMENGNLELLPGVILHTLLALGVITEKELESFSDLVSGDIHNFRGDLVGTTRYHIELVRAP